MDPKKMTPEQLEQFIHRELSALPTRKAPAGFEARFQQALETRQAGATLTSTQLEQLVHRELQALPLRKAPATLEARVIAAIEQRQSVAWWHKSWSYWPTPVKAAFATCSTGLIATIAVGLTFLGRAPQADALAHQMGEKVQGVSSVIAFGTWVVEFTARLFSNIPPLWLYGGLAVIAALYATFFGLGAFAYRTIYRTT